MRQSNYNENIYNPISGRATRATWATTEQWLRESGYETENTWNIPSVDVILCDVEHTSSPYYYPLN